MRPAFSVVVFSTVSGAGCGLLAVAGVMALLGLFADAPAFGAVSVAIATALIGGGLLSSAKHLGRPERMLLALTQWRSSWLSREAVVALATFVPAAVLFVAFLLAWPAWLVAVAGAASALLAVAMVVCTAMIYASLKPIRQWRSPLVVPVYLALALMTGALLLLLLARAFGDPSSGYDTLALIAIVAAIVAKLGYWREADRPAAATDLGTATGLGHLGTVRLLDPPHTEENYIMREMGFAVARRHAYKLRQIAMVCAFGLPLLLTFSHGIVAAAAAVVLAMFGVLVERWLFFAEASHTSILYYGQPA